MTDCPLSGRGQGHVSNFYIADLEHFATASRRCTSVINVDGQPECTSLLYVADCDPLTPLLRFVLVLSCKLVLHCYAVVGLVRFWLTHRVARSVCDKRASCRPTLWPTLSEKLALYISLSLGGMVSAAILNFLMFLFSTKDGKLQYFRFNFEWKAKITVTIPDSSSSRHDCLSSSVKLVPCERSLKHCTVHIARTQLNRH